MIMISRQFQLMMINSSDSDERSAQARSCRAESSSHPSCFTLLLSSPGAPFTGNTSAITKVERLSHDPVDYDPFVKSQLVSRESTSVPCAVQVWSRNPEATNLTKPTAWFGGHKNNRTLPNDPSILLPSPYPSPSLPPSFHLSPSLSLHLLPAQSSFPAVSFFPAANRCGSQSTQAQKTR